jgi:hypothetical protein
MERTKKGRVTYRLYDAFDASEESTDFSERFPACPHALAHFLKNLTGFLCRIHPCLGLRP